MRPVRSWWPALPRLLRTTCCGRLLASLGSLSLWGFRFLGLVLLRLLIRIFILLRPITLLIFIDLWLTTLLWPISLRLTTS